jgi:flagellar biosynthesis/type III secretory pathway chaperone
MGNNSYVLILVQSLKKKSEILDSIIEKNQAQKELLSGSEFNIEAFDENLKEKSELVDELLFLDQGFEEVYERVKEELTSNSSDYTKEIETMKNLIREVADKSFEIRAEEQRNKSLAVNKFSFEKRNWRKKSLQPCSKRVL